MPLRAVGGKADHVEFQPCPLGMGKGSEVMVCPFPVGSLVQLSVSQPQRLQLGCEPVPAEDEHITRSSLASQCERTGRNVMMFALGWSGE